MRGKTHPTNLYDWFAQLLGTLIGTAVGFGLAMWWDRKKERDRESRDRMV